MRGIPPIVDSRADGEQVGIFFLVALLCRAIECLHVIASNSAHPYFGFMPFEDAIEVSVCLSRGAVNLRTQSGVLGKKFFSAKSRCLVVGALEFIPK